MGAAQDGKGEVDYVMTLTHPIKGGLPVTLTARGEDERERDEQRWAKEAEEESQVEARKEESDEDSSWCREHIHRCMLMYWKMNVLHVRIFLVGNYLLLDEVTRVSECPS